jgi:flagellar biosynthesis protein FliR
MYVLNLATTTVGVGVAVAAPAIALSFVIQIALGALSRAVPRFGSVTLAYPLVFGGALIVTALTIPLIVVRAAHPVILIPGATAP